LGVTSAGWACEWDPRGFPCAGAREGVLHLDAGVGTGWDVDVRGVGQDVGASTGAAFGHDVHSDVRALALQYLRSHGILSFALLCLLCLVSFCPPFQLNIS